MTSYDVNLRLWRGDTSGGELVEYAPTNVLFTRPRDPRTDAYVTGRFG